jgi:hypothetical protein
MSKHVRRRHQRNRKAAREVASLQAQFRTNPQFMKRGLDQKGNHRKGHERRALLQAELSNATLRPPAMPAPKPQRQRAAGTVAGSARVQTISSPATTRQVKKGPSKAERERQERRQARRTSKELKKP